MIRQMRVVWFYGSDIDFDHFFIWWVASWPVELVGKSFAICGHQPTVGEMWAELLLLRATYGTSTCINHQVTRVGCRHKMAGRANLARFALSAICGRAHLPTNSTAQGVRQIFCLNLPLTYNMLQHVQFFQPIT